MKNLTLILLLPFSATCWGEWTKVAESHDADFHIDYERIKKRGAFVYYWKLTDLAEPIGGGMSAISYEIADCEMFRIKTLQRTTYRRSMGQGESSQALEASSSDEWRHPSPHSSLEWVLKSACGQ